MCTIDWCGCTNSYFLLIVKFVQIYTLGVGLFVHQASFWSSNHEMMMTCIRYYSYSRGMLCVC